MPSLNHHSRDETVPLPFALLLHPVIIVSVYAQTLSVTEEANDMFYEDFESRFRVMLSLVTSVPGYELTTTPTWALGS